MIPWIPRNHSEQISPPFLLYAFSTRFLPYPQDTYFYPGRPYYDKRSITKNTEEKNKWRTLTWPITFLFLLVSNLIKKIWKNHLSYIKIVYKHFILEEQKKLTDGIVLTFAMTRCMWNLTDKWMQCNELNWRPIQRPFYFILKLKQGQRRGINALLNCLTTITCSTFFHQITIYLVTSFVKTTTSWSRWHLLYSTLTTNTK